MFGFMKKLVRSNQIRGAVRRPPSARPGVEVLEGRLLLSTAPPVFTLIAPASAAAGATIGVGVVEHGGNSGINNNLVSADATITANLYFEVNAASVPLGTASLVDGIGFASVKLPTYPAAGEIVATAGAIAGGKPLTITTGPLTHYVISAPSQANAGAFQITVTAEDAFGNTLTSDENFPTLTASSGGAVSGFNWFEGVGTATVTQFKAGAMTVTAQSGSVTGSATISVIPAAATHFVFTNLPESVTSGTSNVATITAEDAFDNPVANFNQNPTFTATYGFPASVTNYGWHNGQEQIAFSLTAPGVTRLTATAGSVTGASTGVDVLQTFFGPPDWWAGYEVSGLSNVTGVGATWVQPAATGPANARFLTWVGIDGDGSSTVEQCGTKMYVDSKGQAHYVAWYELFGDGSGNKSGPDADEVYISGFTVRPGDTISARVLLMPGTTDSFVFQMTDWPATGGPVENFSLVQTPEYVVPTRTSAEWIVENDNVDGGSQLANFGHETFTGAWAETGPTKSQAATIGSIYSFPGAQAINMVNSAGSAVAVTGDASLSNTPGSNEPGNDSSSSFTVTWAPGSGASVAKPTKVASSTLAAAAAAENLDALDALDPYRDELFW